jgi:acyl transferase domain-containing protein/acyl carrier protein
MDQSEEMDNVDAPVAGVAVIGMVGRFPGANDLDTFWRNIRDGVESITHFTDEQLQTAGVDPQTLKNPSYVKARGVIDGVDQFDAGFFGYSNRDALVMDPQQRLFLQCAWEALEDAGYDPRSYRGLVGVYGGSTASSYQNLLYANFGALNTDGMSIAIGNELPFLTTRVSFKLDLKGPSCPVQTACSTSLVAVHLACQGLLNAECDMALAGGVSLRLPQQAGYVYQEEGILSSDGHCRSFEAQAAGTIFSNGLGIVVLKRLDDALADGDTVYAVIRGSAINNDGARRASFTAPGVGGQSQVVADALASAEVDPETISYLEGHGTATALGDSIEVQALTKAFGTSQRGFCALGSIKANIGHLDAAAGVAGLIKTILAMQNKQIPPTAHFEKPNPDIKFESTPFYVNAKLREWTPAPGTPRRAGVSSFGFGGTNAHVVVEEAPERPPSGPSRPWQLLTLSAEAPKVLDVATSQLSQFLSGHRMNLADAAYTLKVGRRAMRHRRAVVCRTADDAAKALESRDAKAVFTGSHDGPSRPVVFLFPGQGAQYVNMGVELYRDEPAFREVVDRCAVQLTAHLGFDLREVLYPAGEVTEELSRRLTQTSVAQPALFVVEYALARLLMDWGVVPDAMIGHSLGELVAACLSGVIKENDALRLVALRGRLMDEMPTGVMLAVPLPEVRVRKMLGEGLWLAAVNHGSLCVVSGGEQRIAELEAKLREDGIDGQRLNTSHAFHSGLMDEAVEPFVKAVAATSLSDPKIPYISNVSGTWIDASEAKNPAYWGRQIREAVRFGTGVTELLKKEDRLYLEVGPGNILGTLVRRQAPGKAGHVLSTLRHAREEGSALATVTSALGRLWVNGAAIDWTALYQGETRRRVALPPYPFDRQRFWVDPPPALPADSRKVRDRVEGRRPDIDSWFYAPTWARAPLAVSAEGAGGSPNTWLVLLDEYQLGDRVVARLERAGHDVIVVTAADRYRKLGPKQYSIDPLSREDYQLLFKELSGSNRAPGVLLHLFGVGPVSELEGAARNYDGDHERGFGTLLRLAQALGEADFSSPVRIAVVSNDSLDVTGQEMLAPGKATALGLCRVIPQEYPSVSCKYIDLAWNGFGPADFTDGNLDRLLHDAAAEVSDAVVAYRGGHRWVQTFSELKLGEPPAVPERLRKNGVYLITGGLGDIGLQLAKYLLSTVQAKVVLTGRSGIPPREEWARHLERHSQHDSTSQRILRVRELETLGGEVLVLKADAGDAEQMRKALETAEARFGAINGVIHAAGLISGDAFQLIAEVDAAACGRQFQPKIVGLCVLDELIAGLDLDFCLLVSSLSAVLGGLRYAAYAAANIFMDGFAHRRSRTSPYPWLTINWDSWMRTEDETRLAATGAVATGFVLTPTEGIEAFRRLLASDFGVQAIVSTGDLQSRLDQWVNMDAIKASNQPEVSQAARMPRPNLQTDFVAPGTDLERSIAGIWEELLGVDRVGLNDNFFELGGDSFLGIQVIARLKKQLGVKVTAVTLYEGPRVGLLANIIISAGQEKAPAFDHSRLRGERRRERKLGLNSPMPVET